LAGSRLRSHRDAAEEQSVRREGSYLIETGSRDQRDQSQERDLRGEDVRESNRLVESRSSGGRGRRDNDSVRDVQASSMRGLRIDRDGNEGNVEVPSVPRSSAVDERQRVPDRNGSRAQPEGGEAHRPLTRRTSRDRNGRRAQPEDGEAHRPLTRRTSRDRKEMKEQVAHYVKTELKPLYRLGHIDKEQHRSIARLATQELLTVFGIERSGPETRGSGSVSSACTHRSSPSTSSLWPNCCMQCMRHNVSKVVGVLVKRAVGIGLL